MQVFEYDTPLAWGALDLPLLGMTSDWQGRVLEPPLGFTVAADPDNLWFVAARRAPALCRPGAEAGSFTEGLWEWDVAELFLADAESGAYLEFNLAPNGAWWAAKFSSPRVRAVRQPDFASAMTSHWEEISMDGWCAAIRMPLVFLEKEIGYGARTAANATAILNSPQPTFHSAHRLPGAVPDFHQPAAFPVLSPVRP